MPGCTPLENSILDRFDAGLSREAIAAELRLSVCTVKRVVAYYNSGGETNRLWRRAAEVANAAHLAAIAATGRSFA